MVPRAALAGHVLGAVARQGLLVEHEANGAAVAAGVEAVDADVEELAVCEDRTRIVANSCMQGCVIPAFGHHLTPPRDSLNLLDRNFVLQKCRARANHHNDAGVVSLTYPWDRGIWGARVDCPGLSAGT